MNSILLDVEKSQSSTGEAEIWNIYVQILMPLIIVLSFVAMFEIAQYKQGFDERGQEIKHWIKKWEEAQLPAAQREYEHEKELIDLQLQKLMLAVDVVMSAKRTALGFGRTPRAEGIVIDPPTIKDEGFKALCRNVRNLGNIKSFQKQAFKDVLAKAGIRDAAQFDPRSEDGVGHFRGSEVITNENKKHVSARVNERVTALYAELQQMQQDVLSRIFDGLMIRPEALDAKTRALSHKLTDPSVSPADQAEAAQALMRYLNDKVRRSLMRDGYEFLDKTWESINS